MISVLALALLTAAPAPSLAHARAHLAERKPAALVLDLDDGVQLSERDGYRAAALLVQAGWLAQHQHDGVLALQLAQMAHRRDANAPAPLQLLGELALSDRDDAEAERWCAAWQGLNPSDPQPGMLRVRIAADEGDWDTVNALAGALASDGRLGHADQKLAQKLAAQAQAHEPAPTVDPEDAALAQAAAAAALDQQAALAARGQRTADVVVYGASWCVWCHKACNYFKSKGVAFVDKDIEHDPGAKDEMVAKLRGAGLRSSGIPVIDVKGKIIVGFDQASIDRALAQ